MNLYRDCYLLIDPPPPLDQLSRVVKLQGATRLPHVNIIPVYSRGGVWKKNGPFEEKNWTINTRAVCMSRELLFSSKMKNIKDLNMNKILFSEVK